MIEQLKAENAALKAKLAAHELEWRAPRALRLTPGEENILCVFVENVGHRMSQCAIRDKLYPLVAPPDPMVVRVMIHAIRKKLVVCDATLENKRGFGYLLARSDLDRIEACRGGGAQLTLF